MNTTQFSPEYLIYRPLLIVWLARKVGNEGMNPHYNQVKLHSFIPYLFGHSPVVGIEIFSRWWRWWFQIFVIFIPTVGELIQFDLRIFFKWAGSTVQHFLNQPGFFSPVVCSLNSSTTSSGLPRCQGFFSQISPSVAAG